MLSISPHQSGASPLTSSSFVETTRSGLPMRQSPPSAEVERRRHVRGVAAWRAGVGPLRDLGDLLLAQRRVVLVVLDADVLLDVPRRHHAGPRPRPVRCLIARAHGRTSS